MTDRDRLTMVETSTSENPVSFLRIMRKNIILVILIVVLSALCGVLYSVLYVKPVYTASRSVILRTFVDIEEDRTNTSATNDATLAKIHLPNVEAAMKSPNVLSLATEYYKQDNATEEVVNVSGGGVSVKYGDSSLIFSISYTDADANVAKGKLSSLIKAASEKLPELLEAKDVSLINVQNKDIVTEKSSSNKSIVLSTILGVGIAFVVVIIMYALDNTVKNKNEFEYLTGVSVIAVIDKIEEK